VDEPGRENESTQRDEGKKSKEESLTNFKTSGGGRGGSDNTNTPKQKKSTKTTKKKKPPTQDKGPLLGGEGETF